MKNLILYWLLNCTLFLGTAGAGAHSRPAVYMTMLTLNGHPVDHNTVWLNSRGVMALVEGNPQSSTHKPLLFRVLLRRAGKVVKQWPSNQAEGTYSLQLDELWLNARLGDEILVEPFDATKPPSAEQPGKQVIRLRGPNWLAHCLPFDNC